MSKHSYARSVLANVKKPGRPDPPNPRYIHQLLIHLEKHATVPTTEGFPHPRPVLTVWLCTL